MADPYLALTLDAKRRIAQVASALQHPHPGPAAWGLWELLEDVWRRKDPSVSAELLAASFGPDPRVAPLLVAFRFLMVVGEGAWTLAKEEADRLLLTHKQRVAAGKARSASAGRSAGGSFQRATSGQPAGAPAADQRATSGGPALTASSQQPAAKKKILRAAEAAPRPGWQALIDSLVSAYQRIHGEKYVFRGHDARALAELLDAVGGDGERVKAMWERALRHQGFPAVATLPELLRNANHFQGAVSGHQARRPESLNVGGGADKVADETDMWEAYRENMRNEENAK